MPARLSLHWDGKMMADLSGELKEMEAIIVCGSPEYPEGKLSQLSPVTSGSWLLP